MSQKHLQSISPIISLLIILSTLFATVFLQMEVRRIGYVVWKQSREHKSLLDEHRLLVADYAKLTRPQHLQEVAVSRFTLSEPKTGQIIHMSGERFAVKQ